MMQRQKTQEHGAGKWQARPLVRGGVVKHDPLCPVGAQVEYVPAADCGTCDLIAKVRADERAKAMAEDQWISAREAREYEADIRADEREQAAQRIEYITPDRPDGQNNMVVFAFALAADVVRRGEAQ